MKKSTIICGALALAALPFIANGVVNRNALRKGPKVTSEYQTKPVSDPKAAEKAAADSAEMKFRSAKTTPVFKAAPSGVRLPSIIASIYDHVTGEIGMYRLPEVSGGELELISSDISSYYGGALDGSIYYACHDGRYGVYNDNSDPHGHKIQGYDVATWTPVGSEIIPQYYRASDLAISPVDGRGYAYCDLGGLEYRLFSIDMTTGEQTDICPTTKFLSNFPVTVCFDTNGTLYSLSSYGDFGPVDMATGKIIPIADIDLPVNYKSNYYDDNWSMALDPDNGNFLLAVNYAINYGQSHGTNIYTVDPATGATSLIADFTQKSVTSIFVMPDIVDPSAPSAPTDLKANFTDGSLSGDISFRMPSTLYEGAKATGSASWTLYDGSEAIANGTAAYGAEVNTPVTLEAGGKHFFAARASNDAGEGDKARIEFWVGPDYPAIPSGITVAYDESRSSFSITWEAVTLGANGGYVNPANVKYSVTRMPAGVKVGDALTATSFTDTYTPQGVENIYYEVRAAQGTLVSEAGKSPVISVGYMTLPFDLADCDLYEDLSEWTIIDANNDESTWTINSYNGIRYSYSGSNTGDDWIITPPIKALAGCKYTVHVVFANQTSSYPERVEVCMGDAPEAEAMTKVLLPPTVIKDDKGQSFDIEIVPESDGKFHIGVHAISDPDMYYLTMTGLTISAPLNDAAPVAPAIKTLRADSSGALSVSGSVEVPEFGENGSLLTTVSKIEVMRGVSTVAVIQNPTPGSTVDFTDSTVPQAGLYAYKAYAYNGDNMSLPSESVEAYVGVNVPGVARNVKIMRSQEDASTAILTWEAPEIDEHGYPLNGAVTYGVEVYYDNEYVNPDLVYDSLTDRELTFKPSFKNGSGFAQARIYARTDAGYGWYAKSQNVYIGEALPLPFKESFPDYTLENPWGDGLSNGPQIGSITDDILSTALGQYNGWNRMTDSSFDTTEGSQDHDNGFAGMFGWSYREETEEGGYHNEYTDLVSPVIKLSGMENPTLTFYTFNWTNRGISDPNLLDVDVVTADGVRHNALHLVIGDLGNVQDWMFVKVDLSEYKDQEVYLIFKGTIISGGDTGYNWVLIDNIRIGYLDNVDLAVSNITAPTVAEPGETYTVSARVSNIGAADVDSYKAIFTYNGREMESKSMGALASGKFENVEFTHSLNVTSPIGNVYTIKVETNGEGKTDNNTSDEITVARNLQLLPEPRMVDLDEETGRIVWDEPDLTNAPEQFTDDFESYPCIEGDLENDYENAWVTFLTEAGDWIFIDRDQYPIGGMMKFGESGYEYIQFPGIDVHTPQSWWVQNRLYMDFNDTYYGHDYSWQYLANMYVVNDTHDAAMPQDDWAITPELCGREQLLTLWARSYDPNIPETVEFLYSTGSTHPKDFILLRHIEELSGDWTQYAVVIPEGGRRFAIRGCSYVYMGSSQTFVDDVTFYPANARTRRVNLLGYNVYRGNDLLNTTPLTDLTYAIGQTDDKTAYSVSAVYTEGESRAVTVGSSGVASVDMEGVEVSTGPGLISISGLQGKAYAVVSASGILCASGADIDKADVSVAPGVYIVRISGNAVKVIVK